MSENTKKYYWLKLKEDFFDDKVTKYLRRLPEGPSLIIIYLKMQLKSLKTEGFIRYDGILPTCEDELALALDENPVLVSATINALERIGVVERWENDTLYMAAMQELIGSETAVAERVRRHRAARKQLPNALQCNANKLPCNGNVTKGNTEIEGREREDLDLEGREETEGSTADEPPAPPPVPYERIKKIYNSLCPSFSRCTALSEARRKAIKARFASGYTIEDFQQLFTKAEASSFLKGRNSRNWTASFDWLIKDANMAKVLDGNYDDHHPGSPTRNDDLDFIPD